MLWFRSIAGSVGITATRGIGRAECMRASVCVCVFVQAGVLVGRASRYVLCWCSCEPGLARPTESSAVCVCVSAFVCMRACARVRHESSRVRLRATLSMLAVLV